MAIAKIVTNSGGTIVEFDGGLYELAVHENELRLTKYSPLAVPGWMWEGVKEQVGFQTIEVCQSEVTVALHE